MCVFLQDEGCQHACQFYEAESPSIDEAGRWAFPEEPAVQIMSSSQLIIDWLHTQQVSGNSPYFPLYVVFWRYDGLADWQLACMVGI